MKKGNTVSKMTIMETKEKIKSLDSKNLGALVFENRMNNAYIQNILENPGRLPHQEKQTKVILPHAKTYKS